VIRSVPPLSYNIGSQYLVHTFCTLIMEGTCHPDNCHLTLISNFIVQFFVMRSVCLLPYNLGLSYLIHTLIMEGTCQPDICHLTLTSFSQSTDFVKLLSSFCDYISFISTIQPRFTIFGPYIEDGRCMSLPYNLESPYLIHTLMMDGACHYHTT
jgi:hypothetical protein